jgi:cell division protease FtsH
VTKVTISRNRVLGLYRDNNSFRVTVPYSQEAMLQVLQQKNVEIWFRTEAESTGLSWLAWFLNIAPLVLLAALWFFMVRQMKQAKRQP